MSIQRILVPVLAVGGLLAVIAAASQRRERARDRDLERAIRPSSATPEFAELPPGEIVLPLAFWDATAELDLEDELPLASHALGLSEEPYDSMSLEDASATWLSRATQTPLAHGSEEIDDPAEIAADSMSMISEASRSAAADPAAASERGAGREDG